MTREQMIDEAVRRACAASWGQTRRYNPHYTAQMSPTYPRFYLGFLMQDWPGDLPERGFFMTTFRTAWARINRREA